MKLLKLAGSAHRATLRSVVGHSDAALGRIVSSHFSREVAAQKRLSMRPKHLASLYTKIANGDEWCSADGAALASMAKSMREAIDEELRTTSGTLVRVLPLEPRWIESVDETFASGTLGSLLLQMVATGEAVNAEDCSVNLSDVLNRALADLALLSREKFSVVPPIELGAVGVGRVWASEGLLHFVVFELLKNAVGATINRYGALDVDDAPPIRIAATQPMGEGGRVELTISDAGEGIAADGFERIGSAFHTTFMRPAFLNEGGGASSGVAFSGSGFGTFKSGVFASFIDAEVCVASDGVGRGATVSLSLSPFRAAEEGSRMAVNLNASIASLKPALKRLPKAALKDVLALERAGKNRSTLVTFLEQRLANLREED